MKSFYFANKLETLTVGGEGVPLYLLSEHDGLFQKYSSAALRKDKVGCKQENNL